MVLNNQYMDNYDLSIIMPFYKRVKIFKPVFRKKHQFFQRNGIELILCVDEPSEQAEILELVKEYPLINWKIILNEKDHEWRNPAKAINVGIRHASKKYILQMDPELEFLTDVIHTLRLNMSFYPNHYAIGRVIFSSLDQEITIDNFEQLNLEILPFGSILAKKTDFEAVLGYNENYSIWGGEDDNIRTRFDLMGLKRLYYPDAVLIHREDFSKRKTSRKEQRMKIGPDLLANMLIPYEVITNGQDWGKNFNKIIYSWEMPSAIKKTACVNYLKTIGSFDLLSDDIFEKKYNLIVLIPVYNGSLFIEKCIKNILPHCDGIIILDDESTDDSYNLGASEKTLLRVKKTRNGFDDLANRNILLDIASFFCSEWLMTLDSDEWLSNKWNDLHHIMNMPDIDMASIWLVNLWNSEEYYRADMYDKSFSQKGLWMRWRLFRNKGRMQIHCMDDRKLHFVSIPYYGSYYISSIILLHAGYLTEKYRTEKFSFYKEEDKQELEDYDQILQDQVELAPINQIDAAYLSEQRNNMALKLSKFFKK